MDSPIVAVKEAISPGKIIATVLGLLVVFAIVDFLGWTNWIVYPYTTARAKFMPSPTTS